MPDAPIALLILVVAYIVDYLIGYSMHIEGQTGDHFVHFHPWLKLLFRTPRSDGRYELVALCVQIASISCLAMQLLIWSRMQGYERSFVTIFLLALPLVVPILRPALRRRA